MSVSHSPKRKGRARAPSSRARRGGRPASPRAALAEGRPNRTCAACREVGTPDELVRFVLGPDGTVGVDLAGGAFGRGAWLHPIAKCLRGADKALARGFGEAVVDTSEQIQERILVAAQRRIQGLLLAARRAHCLALGVDASSSEWNAGKAELVIIASDVGALARSHWVLDAVASGRVMVFLSRAELGEMLGRDEISALGLLDIGLGRSLRTTMALAIESRSILAQCRIVERSEAG